MFMFMREPNEKKIGLPTLLAPIELTSYYVSESIENHHATATENVKQT